MIMNTYIKMAAVAAVTLGGLINTAVAGESHGHIVNVDDVAWTEISPGAEQAVFWGSEEEGNAIWAFRMQPGVEFPLHAHTHDYHGIALQGNWTHIAADGSTQTHGQEAFAYVKGGEFHGDRCEGPEVCITLVDLDGPRDLYFPQ